jgi:pimeloyl-ACP methyl ester carboxylesterase
MRVVILHGRAAQMDIPATIRRDYEDALRFGLERIGSSVDQSAIDVRFAFYGDIWRPDLRQPLPRIEPAPPGEEFGLPGVGDISLWVDEHLGVGDALLEHILRDVDDYFTEPDLRRLTNARLGQAVRSDLPNGEKAIVVGFSMGSLVAYDSLRSDGSLPVAALITIGSPLAMPSFYRRVENSAPAGAAVRTPFPSQLGMWVNVWTKDDPATAGHYQMGARYPAAPPSALVVQDVETWGRSASPTNPAVAHNASDYMSSRVFATALHAALVMVGGQA